MKAVLLDTHVFVWALADTARLPAAAWPILRDPARQLFISVASAWELAIKSSQGKLTLPGGVLGFVGDGCRRAGVTLLGVDLAHVAEVAALPPHHRDPFDRMIVAQARVNDLALLSFDAAMDAYACERAL